MLIWSQNWINCKKLSKLNKKCQKCLFYKCFLNFIQFGLSLSTPTRSNHETPGGCINRWDITVFIQIFHILEWLRQGEILYIFLVMQALTLVVWNKEIQIILRLFLVIAMYCQASSSQFNKSLNLPRSVARWLG